MSKRLQPTKQKLVELIAIMEAGVDFAEDDVAVIPDEQILSRIAAVRAPLDELLASFAFGKVVHEGLTLAIVGRPNVGKSSLFNRLVERERAIVTATPGTTRDLVSETVSIGGIPVRLVDTAGIRTALDEAESIGVRKSMEALADADIVLVVLDASRSRKRQRSERARRGSDQDWLARRLAWWRETRSTGADKYRVRLGLPAFRLPEWFRLPRSPARASPNCAAKFCGCSAAIPVRNRRAASSPTSASRSWWRTRSPRSTRPPRRVPLKTPHEMMLLDLYGALRPLDDITGATTADDILNLIFSSFCIGK